MAIIEQSKYRLECDFCTQVVGWEGDGTLPEGWYLCLRRQRGAVDTIVFCCTECMESYARHARRGDDMITWYQPVAEGSHLNGLVEENTLIVSATGKDNVQIALNIVGGVGQPTPVLQAIKREIQPNPQPHKE